MSYKHGIYVQEQATSITPPVQISAGLPVVYGTAPINLASDGVGSVNVPRLCYTYEEAVASMGYSSDWDNYTLCEFIYSHFALFNMAPVVLINVLDPATHKTAVPDETITLVAGSCKLASLGAVKSSVVIKSTDGNTTYQTPRDYSLAFDDDGYLVVTRVSTGTIASETASLKATYNKLDPSAVDANDIIGGIDATTGARTGLELLNEVYPRFRLVPGLVLAPGWSDDSTVEAVMKAKAGNINGLFKALPLVDIPTDTVTKYSDVPSWKTTNNYVSEREAVCWPMVALGNKRFHLSTQLAGIICKTDAAHGDIPYKSPSNEPLQADSSVLADGTDVFLGHEEANYLNGQGVVTALNFVNGWTAWGNRTGCYPANTDPKDAFIPVRRMFDWIANTIILSHWKKVDNPLNRRQIDTVVDSINIWLNGLAAIGALLGGRVAFVNAENPTTSLIDGIVKYHVYLGGQVPNREIDFVLEFDTSYFANLAAA